MGVPLTPADGVDAAALAAFVSDCVGAPVTVDHLTAITSVGNAREPWAFTARWSGVSIEVVLLIKRDGDQVGAAIGPEFRTLQQLTGRGVPAPPALWLDEYGTALGRPWFATQRVPGAASTRILRQHDTRDTAIALTRQLAAAAARLHALDIEAFDHLPATEPTSTAETQVTRWEDQFLRHRLAPHPELMYLFAWLRRHPPAARRISVVHGDLRFGNLLYDEDRLTALLDWEMVHLGDPVEDLAWVYRSVWTPERHLPFDDFLAAYSDAGGTVPDERHLRWYQVLAEVKHATISLSAARAFADRTTLDLRHADRAATLPGFMSRALALASAC